MADLMAETACKKYASPMIELVIPQRRRDLGGFEVGRVLPEIMREIALATGIVNVYSRTPSSVSGALSERSGAERRAA